MGVIPLQLAALGSWRVFMLCTALVCVASALAFLWMPESPKFLAARGRQREAIRVLARIHAANTRRHDFPVRRWGRGVTHGYEEGGPGAAAAAAVWEEQHQSHRGAVSSLD